MRKKSKAYQRTVNGLALFGLINIPGFFYGMYKAYKDAAEKQRLDKQRVSGNLKLVE
jgi:hypothetical protein